jgi:hypothetical protein
VEKSPLAGRADSKKFQLVGHGFEAVLSGNTRLNFTEKTLVNLDDLRAPRANQMVVMAVVALADEFKPRRAVAKIKPFYHAHLLQQVHGAINGGQIAPAFGHGGQNLAVRQRMRMPPQNLQNGLARAGDFPGPSAQTAGQSRKVLPLARMGMGTSFHCHSKNLMDGHKSKTAQKLKARNVKRENSNEPAHVLRFTFHALFHQQRLARALDGAGQPALVMRGQAGVFAGQDAALVGHKLPEQIGVLEVERVGGEINLRLRTLRAGFRHAVGPMVIRSFLVGFAGHGYLISR